MLIEIEGEVWKFTQKQWRAYVVDGCRDGARLPREYGAKSVGVIAHSPLDWEPGDFGYEMARLCAERAPKK